MPLTGTEGSDTITFDGTGQSGPIDLLAGNDTLNIGWMNYSPITLTTGAGKDTIRFTTGVDAPTTWLNVTDFTAGAGGDVVDFMPFLDWYLNRTLVQSVGWTTGSNPFLTGHLELRQNGTTVELWFHPWGADGPYSYPMAKFLNTNLADFTAENFSGLDVDAGPSPTENHLISADLTIAAGQTIDVHNPDLYSAIGPVNRPLFVYNDQGGDAVCVNHGNVIASLGTDIPSGQAPGDLMGFVVSASSGTSSTALFHNAADGSFVVDSLWIDVSGIPIYGYTYGFYAGNVIAFQNDGHFEVQAASGKAYGYYISGPSPYFSAPFANTGTFSVTSAYEAYGLWMGTANDFTNSGTITVHGDDYAVGVFRGNVQSSFVSCPIFYNSGQIVVTTDPSSPNASVGIIADEVSVPSDGAYHYYNSGLIQADIAIYVLDGGTSELITDYVHNSGTIHGDVYLSKGNDWLENGGLMSGATLLAEGDDHYVGTNGRHDGTVEGGAGNDELIGGSFVDIFFGDDGGDVLAGGGGDDFLEGGLGADQLSGGAGFDTISFAESPSGVNINLAQGTAFDGMTEDTLSGFERVLGSWRSDRVTGSAGEDVVRGLGGNDHIDGGAGDDTLAGDKDDDIITTGAGKDIIIFQAGDGQDTVIDFAPGDMLQIFGYSSAQSISQAGSDVVLVLSGGDRITFANINLATVQAGLVFSPDLLDVPVRPADRQVVVADEDLVVSNGVTLILDDPVASPFDAEIYSAGLLLGSSADAIPRLFNGGTLQITDSAYAGTFIGVSVAAFAGSRSGEMVNLATGILSVTTTGLDDAIGAFSVTHIWNLGTIHVASYLGNAIGISDSGHGTYSGDQLVNAGTLEVAAGLRAVGIGQLASTSNSSNLIFNSGSILVHGGTASCGIEWKSGSHPALPPSALVNSGSIQATDDTVGKDSAGILLDWGGHAALWNSGTIEGDYSIKRGEFFSGLISDQLSVYNSGQLIGDADFRSADPDESDNIIFVNAGSVQGDIYLHAGNDTFDGRAGTLSGALFGGTGNDQLLTGAGVQTIDAGAGDDRLSGGAGADYLTGGAGADMFRFETGFGIDTIADFNAAAGDRIEVRGYANWTNLVQQGADVVVTFAVGQQLVLKNVNLADINASHFVFNAAAIAANSIPTAPKPAAPPPTPGQTAIDAHNDFNGDGRSDILWRNDNGTVTDWLGRTDGRFDGNTANANIKVGADWQAAGIGDFNGDGRDDVLWRSDSGALAEWLGQTNGGFHGNASANSNVATSWHVAGVGDFNGDGRDDILWRNDNGTVTDWLGRSDGRFDSNTANANIKVGPGWHVAGVGDFNGDGRDDILWRNDNGALAEWLGKANGGFAANAGVNNNVATSWHVAGVADFNGDGRDDILWRNDNGAVTDWLGQSDGRFAGNTANANIKVGADWHVAGVGDFNGDGRDDILWRNDNGALAEWLGQANGGFHGNASANYNVATSWHVQSPDIF